MLHPTAKPFEDKEFFYFLVFYFILTIISILVFLYLFKNENVWVCMVSVTFVTVCFPIIVAYLFINRLKYNNIRETLQNNELVIENVALEDENTQLKEALREEVLEKQENSGTPKHIQMIIDGELDHLFRVLIHKDKKTNNSNYNELVVQYSRLNQLSTEKSTLSSEEYEIGINKVKFFLLEYTQKNNFLLQSTNLK